MNYTNKDYKKTKYDSYNKIRHGFNFLPYVSIGVTTGLGINAGIGLIIPISDRSVIGGSFSWHNSNKFMRYFSFGFMLGGAF
jgi:hypothetical protein